MIVEKFEIKKHLDYIRNLKQEIVDRYNNKYIL